jgi:hypothetical protein
MKVLPSAAGFGDVEEGAVYYGRVNNVTDFGVFVTLSEGYGDDEVTGLMHISNLKPLHRPTDFGVGDQVAVEAQEVNVRKQEIALGLVRVIEGLKGTSDDEGWSGVRERVAADGSDEDEEDESVPCEYCGEPFENDHNLAVSRSRTTTTAAYTKTGGVRRTPIARATRARTIPAPPRKRRAPATRMRSWMRASKSVSSLRNQRRSWTRQTTRLARPRVRRVRR